MTEFVFKVSRYTTWPQDLESYHIHAVGFDSEQRSAFERLAERDLKGKSVLVSFDEAASTRDPEGPDVVILGSSMELDPSEWCFSKEPILLIVICETADSNINFCPSSIINVRSNRGRIEFDANQSEAERIGLDLSARMLSLANEVR